MSKFEINRTLGGADDYTRTVEAAKYRQEGEYIVFYADSSFTKKVLTVKASIVSTIDTLDSKR
jgi:hypothetical protein